MAATNIDIRSLIDALSPEVTDRFQRGYAEAWAKSNAWHKSLVDRLPTENDNFNLLLEVDNNYIHFAPIGTAPDISAMVTKYWPVRLEKVIPTGVWILETQLRDKLAVMQLTRRIDALTQYGVSASKIKVIDQLRFGNTNPAYVGYDGQQYFSNTHAVGAAGVAYDNLEPGDAISTAALTADNVNALIAKLMTVPAGPDGRPYPLVDPKFTVIVPPQLAKAAKEIANNTWTPDSNRFTENVMKGWFDVVVEPQLGTEPTTWYIILTDEGIKPWVNIYMDTPGSNVVVPLIAPTDRNVYDNDRFEWRFKAFEQTALVRFEFAIKVVGS
jgi:hypothetical protein